MRFRLRSLFVVMTFAAMICGVAAWFSKGYYVQLRTVNSLLAEYPEIDRVWLITNYDAEFEVEQVYFSIGGQSGLTFGIVGIDGASKSEIRKKMEDALREKQPVMLPNYATELSR